jgi:hypothetical protein
VPTNPPRPVTTQDKVTSTVQKATYTSKRVLRDYWPIGYIALLIVMFAIAFDYRTAAAFGIGLLMGAVVAQKWR